MEKNINTLTEKDLNIIKEFITLYESIQEKFEEYIKLCETINKNIIFQHQSKKMQNSTTNEIIKQALKELSSELNETQDNYKKNMLKIQYENLQTQLKNIEKYKEIEIKYNEIYYGNLEKYFKQEEQKEEEKPTKEYKKNDIQQKDYYFNKKSTMTQIYEKIKYLYKFYNDYYKEKKEIYVDEELIKNNLKFYFIFKDAIITYMNEKKEEIKKIIDKLESNDETLEDTTIKRVK